eukprot:6476462-Amphidinium_carterae.1
MLEGSGAIASIIAAGAVGITAGDAAPLERTCSVFVLLPKKDDALLRPDQLRPLSLMSCVLKVVLRSLAADLNVPVCLGANLSMLKLDLRLCYGTYEYRRKFGTFCAYSWRTRIHSFNGTEQCTKLFPFRVDNSQGSPVAAWVFIVSLSPWLQYLSTRTVTPALVQAYMDDVRFSSDSSATCRDMVLQFHCLALLKNCTGLIANMLKTVVLQLGHMEESEWRARVLQAMRRHGTLHDQLIVCTATKQLGHVFGDSPDYDGEAAGKMLHGLELVQRMQVGLPRHVQLLKIVATSVTRHQLMAYFPSELVRAAWKEMASALGAGPRGWAKEILIYGKELFGLPQSLELLEAVSLQQRIRALSCLHLNDLSKRRSIAWREAEASWPRGDLL